MNIFFNKLVQVWCSLNLRIFKDVFLFTSIKLFTNSPRIFLFCEDLSCELLFYLEESLQVCPVTAQALNVVVVVIVIFHEWIFQS